MLLGVARPPLCDRLLNRVRQRAHGDDRPGHKRSQHDGDVVPKGVLVHVAVGSKAFPGYVPGNTRAENQGYAAAPRYTKARPWRDQRRHPGIQMVRQQQRPFPSQRGEAEDNNTSAIKRGYRALWRAWLRRPEDQRSKSQNFFPVSYQAYQTKHADAEGRCHLHIGGGPASEADDARAGPQ